jgi:tetratricopeptide (TPR) repeat protein
MRLIPVFCLAASPLLADGCPTAPDHAAALEPLYEALQSAPNEMVARDLSRQLWQLWDDAPDEASQQMLNEGMGARSVADYARARDRFDALVGYCPFYAEGYNQRAFVSFLQGDYAAALPDLDAALELNPRHIGALSGKALTLLALGREDEGQEVLREALALNPWLSERRLLRPAAPAEDL